MRSLLALRGSPCSLTIVIKNSNCRVVQMLLSRDIEGSFINIRVGEKMSTHFMHLSRSVNLVESRPPDVTIYKIGRRFLWVDSPSCKSCQVLAANSAIPTNIMFVRDSGVVVSFLSPGPLVCRKILDEMKEAGLQVELLSKTSLDMKHVLTRRQRDILYTAFSMGYFSPSRQTTLREIADALGLSKSTVSRHLRAALRKLAISTPRQNF